ncbi:hypothetical protein SAMN05216496_4715 [Pseudomonas sp. Z003-0.4C(8344-21)]|uniref:hypothetical protein n=1 Tax=Pseudomonas sp. Z003-0.4C(8344-21) TaxID=1855380 RepID=UPI00087C78C4|nr:hypothetical protein [Pseudomonas sp. Z003-0.4C(8344-21)]SDT46186.1 hypothetical protein SAMN05216496_4715 [Pseudomonas sp. Z003-0.4C(8344-21)]
MPWLRTGTVNVTNNSPAVIGVNVDFVTNVRVGDAFVGPDGRQYEVSNIASPTMLSIIPAYQGTTANAAAYSIMPVQGYPKALADAFNNLNVQYGPKLAALGDASAFDVLPVRNGGTGTTDVASARLALGLGAVATDTVVPVVRGGTGGNSPATARAGLGLGSAAVAALVGTVGQDKGVPTGAVIERGANANGEYVKFADGTLICTLYGRGGIPFNNPSNMGFNWIYPMPFAAPGFVIGNLVGVLGVSRQVTSVGAYSRGLGFASICAFSLGQFAQNDEQMVSFDCFAIGRWF